jgi:hypothetical protein
MVRVRRACDYAGHAMTQSSARHRVGGGAASIAHSDQVAPDTATTARSLRSIEINDSDRGVTVRFDVPPSDIGDAWISLDASLEAYDLETTGIYRQTLTPQGGVILQAPVKEQSAEC